jgi:hypothetical protein
MAPWVALQSQANANVLLIPNRLPACFGFVLVFFFWGRLDREKFGSSRQTPSLFRVNFTTLPALFGGRLPVRVTFGLRPIDSIDPG